MIATIAKAPEAPIATPCRETADQLRERQARVATVEEMKLACNRFLRDQRNVDSLPDFITALDKCRAHLGSIA
jgi:hypothetical protein